VPSQRDEDRIILSAIRRHTAMFSCTKRPSWLVIDIGANDGVTHSSTYEAVCALGAGSGSVSGCTLAAFHAFEPVETTFGKLALNLADLTKPVSMRPKFSAGEVQAHQLAVIPGKSSHAGIYTTPGDDMISSTNPEWLRSRGVADGSIVGKTIPALAIGLVPATCNYLGSDQPVFLSIDTEGTSVDLLEA